VLPAGIGALAALQQLRLNLCPKLQGLALPPCLGQLAALRELVITDRYSLSGWRPCLRA
jgi:hypothetical protein